MLKQIKLDNYHIVSVIMQWTISSRLHSTMIIIKQKHNWAYYPQQKSVNTLPEAIYKNDWFIT